jgi:hypothetical protein
MKIDNNGQFTPLMREWHERSCAKDVHRFSSAGASRFTTFTWSFLPEVTG